MFRLGKCTRPTGFGGRPVLLANRATKVLVVFAGVLVVLVVGLLVFGFYLYRLSLTLPDLGSDPYASRLARTSVVFAADGSVIADWHGNQDRTVVPLDQIPDTLRDATVAAEDRRFYQHNGVDSQSVKQALRGTQSSNGDANAGSTITLQLVKIMFPSTGRSITDKIKQALLAYELSAKSDKNKVLGAYLNSVYFGRGAYGAEAAATRYFGKPAKSLDIAESATLAGIIRSPSRYGRLAANTDTLNRRNQVLEQMVQQGYIATETAQAAQAEKLQFVPPKEAGQVAPYFVEYVKQDLLDRLGPSAVYGGGLRVYTSLEPSLQSQAEKAALKLSEPGDPEVAIVSVRPADGHIVAMVGGRDFSANQFNLATQGRRQPGSAFKPFVLVTALKQGISPDQVFEASPTTISVSDGVWNVQNYENKFTAGSMSLRAATDFSVNGVFARLIMVVGPKNVVQTAKQMGITTPVDANPAIALGGLKTGVSPVEMASAYGTIANHGLAVPPTGIVEVTDDAGHVVYKPAQKSTRAMSGAVADTAALMLHDVIEHGTAGAAKISTWAAGKTGTTSSYRDAWFVGWAGSLSTAVWVGNRQAQVPMLNVHGQSVTGGSFPSGIWHDYMETAALAHPTDAAPSSVDVSSAQAGLVLCTICEDSLLLANPRCPHTIKVYLEPSLVPKTACTLH